MKIALLAPANSIHILKLANGFAKKNHDVTIISLHQPCGGYSDSINFKILPIKAPFGYILSICSLRKYFKANSFDIVHVHYATGYGTFGMLTGLKNAILSVWGSDVLIFPSKSLLHRLWIQRILLYYKEIISTSFSMADIVGSLNNKAEIHVIPFGVDIDLFKPNNNKNSNIIQIVTVKSLKPVYAINKTITAFSILRDKFKNQNLLIQLKIIGSGPEKEKLEQQVSFMGLNDFVQFIPAMENAIIPEILSKSDISCYLSHSESFGVSVLESLACGVPCVCSDTLGFQEIITHDKTGYIVNNGNPEAAAEAMERLILDEKIRDNFAKEGRKIIENKYSLSHSINSLLDLYKNHLKSKQ